jgi:hypothetical protein
LEAGERAAELTQETSAMLEAQLRLDPALDVDTAISNILWKEARRTSQQYSYFCPEKRVRLRRV